jgi:hypothetical protein
MFAFAGYIVVSMALYQVSPEVREHEQQQTPSSTQMIKKIHHLQKADSSTAFWHLPKLQGDTDSPAKDRKKHN